MKRPGGAWNARYWVRQPAWERCVLCDPNHPTLWRRQNYGNGQKDQRLPGVEGQEGQAEHGGFGGKRNTLYGSITDARHNTFVWTHTMSDTKAEPQRKPWALGDNGIKKKKNYPSGGGCWSWGRWHRNFCTFPFDRKPKTALKIRISCNTIGVKKYRETSRRISAKGGTVTLSG